MDIIALTFLGPPDPWRCEKGLAGVTLMGSPCHMGYNTCHKAIKKTKTQSIPKIPNTHEVKTLPPTSCNGVKSLQAKSLQALTYGILTKCVGANRPVVIDETGLDRLGGGHLGFLHLLNSHCRMGP